MGIALFPLEEYLNVVAPPGRVGDNHRFCYVLPAANVLLSINDSVSFQGVKMESIYSGTFDRVKISTK